MERYRYGVLKARALRYIHGFGSQPHFHIALQDDRGTQYRTSINIKSKAYPSELLYRIGPCKPDDASKLQALPSGFTPIERGLPVHGLDFVRRPLFGRSDMVPLPASLPGPDNDLNEKIVARVDEAIAAEAELYIFGDCWGPEPETPDYFFGFKPGRGIHNIHMNQGNAGPWHGDNGAFQDGGVLVHFKQEDRWIGLFLAFQSQSWNTDERGHAAD
ncbi:YukJ family protein [Saccharibacillus sp. CPCC 101409]|uniref:YukJ family protein n=1 Tax=Saccharibacillus sp. CPCC 101409 TaxID=3058041 RepID=UPI002672AA35|nr:YukJ family protein [Saccharibacillus sp. CPCC 101409]MDO3412564.1 YukJ family protein [Saccharibacillus sp. CPCC 101409]